MRALLAASSALSLWGCVSHTGFGRASTLPEGTSQLSAGLEGTLVLVDRRRGPAIPLPAGQLTAGYRRGVGERTEAGARLFGISISRAGVASFGAALDGKYELVRVRRRHLSIGTSLGYHQVRFGTPWHFVTASVPLLAGHDFGRSQLVIGPRLAFTAWMGEGQNTVELLQWGASIAFAWRLTRWFQLVPELVVLYCPVSFNGEVTSQDRAGATLVQLGIGGSFDL